MSEVSRHDSLLELLVGLGFNKHFASRALEECDNHLENTIQMLLDTESTKHRQKTERESAIPQEPSPAVEPEQPPSPQPKVDCEICDISLREENFPGHQTSQPHLQLYLNKKRKKKLDVSHEYSVEERGLSERYCSKCDIIYGLVRNFRKHVKKMHASVVRVFCDICQEKVEVKGKTIGKKHKGTKDHLRRYISWKAASLGIRRDEESFLVEKYCEPCDQFFQKNKSKKKHDRLESHLAKIREVAPYYAGESFVWKEGPMNDLPVVAENFVTMSSAATEIVEEGKTEEVVDAVQWMDLCVVCKEVAKIGIVPCGHFCFCESDLCQAYMEGRCPQCSQQGRLFRPL